jgi:acetolactate synthase-1/2/3 large subunit
LDFPADVADVPISETESVIRPAISQASVSGDVVAAAKALEDAKRVVVVVGTDALRARAGKEILHLVEKNRAVALTTWRARGLFPEDHPRYGTMFYGNFTPETGEMDYLRQADLVVLAGVDPVEISQPWPIDMPILQVHLSPEISEACPSAPLKLYGPLRRALGTLTDLQVNPAGFSEEQIRTSRQNALARFAPSTDDRLPAQEAMLRMRKVFPRQGILVQETGIYNVLNEHIWTVYEPGTYVSTGGSRTMGAAIPWAIGTALARPNEPVLAFSGDGGFLMRLQELEVVARLSLKIIFVVFSDGQLGTIEARRVARGLEAPGLNFAPVDFAAIARGFGLHAAVVGRLDQLEAALEQALTTDRATVIELKLDPAFYTSLFSRMLGTARPIKEINPMKGIQREDH